MVAKKDSPIVVAMPDHPPDGLVHSPGCLLPVPVVSREELKWGGEGLSCQLEHSQPTLPFSGALCPHPPTTSSQAIPLAVTPLEAY